MYLLSISLKKYNNYLILDYSPAMGISDISERLSQDEEVTIKKTFTVTKKHLLDKFTNEDEYKCQRIIEPCAHEILSHLR